MRILSIFLTLVVLIAGLLSCADPTADERGRFNLTVSSSGGGSVISPGEDTFAYEEGAVVDLVATADDGYHFVEWTGDVDTIVDVEAATTTITMESDYSITANFAEIPPARYILTVSSTTGGSVIAPGEGTFTYDAGTVVDLVAEADTGYRFTYWTGSVGAVDDVNAASTTVTMMDDYTITASFAKEIRTWHDLDAIRDNLGGTYILMSDLDSATAGYDALAGPAANELKGWKPIGDNYDPFAGSFDGQGYDVRDLFIDRPPELYVGLFGYVASEGVIANTGVVDAEVTGRFELGILAGWNDGTVANSFSGGSVAGGPWAVGGLVGRNDGTVSNSYSSANVYGVNDVGGLIGGGGGSIIDSYASGSVTGDWRLGGLIGMNWGTVSNSYYDHSEVRINGDEVISIGAMLAEDFEQWLANDKFLDVEERLQEEDGYYVIDSVGDFKQLLVFGQDGSLRFRLKNDLDLSTEASFFIPYLAGEFYGDGHKISNVSVKASLVSKVGLFGYLAPGGKVSHVGLEDADITGRDLVGGLVGLSRQGTVTNSYSAGSVSGHVYVGGLVGESDCGIVTDSHSSGTVTGDEFVGGLVGGNRVGMVSRSSCSGRVTGEWVVGGLAGWNDGTISESRSTGTISGGGHVGGLVGENRGIVNHTYSSGSVTGERLVGGLVGRNDGTVSNSYSASGVTAYDHVGGLVAWNRAGVSNSFWDMETSGTAESDGGTGKSTGEMMNIATFADTETDGLDEPWDIVAVAVGETDPAYIWNIVDGQTYPFLSWEPVT